MKINWKIRFKNKVWLASFVALCVSFLYQILAMFNIFPAITQETFMQGVNIALMLLSAGGVIVDPTTSGMSDSNQAMEYNEPRED